jgi:post-segregation antitoxin (ccd killing protein)
VDKIRKSGRDRKRSTNLTLPKSPMEEAPAPDINLSQTARAIAVARDEGWVRRNREAMASYDASVAEQGLILEDLRIF